MSFDTLMPIAGAIFINKIFEEVPKQVLILIIVG